MLSKSLEFSLNLAFKWAKDKRHESITVEHLLLSLLDNDAASDVLKICGANLEDMRRDLIKHIKENTPTIAADEVDYDTQPTMAFQRVLQRAVFHVQSAAKDEVSGANVLAAIFSEKNSHAVYLLHRENVSRYDVVNYISHGISKSYPEKQPQTLDPEVDDPDNEDDNQTTVKNKPLDLYCTNLNKKAETGGIDSLIGRTQEVQRAVQILCRRQKNNPLFIGESGVGKTAIVEGLAKHIVDAKVPDVIAGSVIYSLDLAALLAGTKYRGDFEKRFKKVICALQKEANAVLFIDEIHTIVGTGSTSGSAMDCANLLKPLLSGNELKCIGSSTYAEYRDIFAKDNALARRFQKIDVTEPSVDETVTILQGLREKLQAHHGVNFSDAALQAAAELSARYISDRFLPDKAIDIVDEAGAYQKICSTDKRTQEINVAEIEAVVAKMARIPIEKISTSAKKILSHLKRDLQSVVFGQDKAINALTDAIKLSRSGLRDLKKPVGSFLFAGPTGVGKTEITRQLATILGIELIRFDMSEYMEKHSISRLIGSPPGYVGCEEGGLLTEAINKHPYSVLLLDEIEKAHPDIYNLLLQVMDHGTLTDPNGRKADFRHVIIVMTTNVGAFELERPSLGFTQQDNNEDKTIAINTLFTPEFRNRLDAAVHFSHLTPATIHLVVNKFMTELKQQLESKSVTLDIDDAACGWLADHGYDRAMGARNMDRIIEQHVKKPLAEELLFGKLSEGGHVRIIVADEQLSFDIESS